MGIVCLVSFIFVTLIGSEILGEGGAKTPSLFMVVAVQTPSRAKRQVRGNVLNVAIKRYPSRLTDPRFTGIRFDSFFLMLLEHEF